MRFCRKSSKDYFGFLTRGQLDTAEHHRPPFPADAAQESPRSTYRLPRRDRPISFTFPNQACGNASRLCDAQRDAGPFLVYSVVTVRNKIVPAGNRSRSEIHSRVYDLSAEAIGG